MTNDVTKILREFSESKVNPRQYSPLALAFIGDSIYDLIIRTKVVSKANAPVNKLHGQCRAFVKASAQAKIAHMIMEELTPDEQAVFKRGRNAKSASVPKNANLMDYKNATGLEALIGFLYLQGNLDRIIEIMHKGIQGLEEGTTEV